MNANTKEVQRPESKVQSPSHSQSLIANGRADLAVGTRVIVYSGPHYGRVHRVVGRPNRFSSSVEVRASTSRDRFFASFCDLEVVP
jgi:hypothetical protein